MGAACEVPGRRCGDEELRSFGGGGGGGGGIVDRELSSVRC